MPAKKTEKTKTADLKETVQKFVLTRPHISEKATVLAEDGVYTFRVLKQANKIEIKREVEAKYKVNVEGVRTIHIPSKKRRMGRIEGKKKDYKKAIVKIKKGQSIDLTSA